MRKIFLFAILFLLLQSVKAELHPCIKLSRDADWLNILLKCQDLAIDKNDQVAAYVLGYMSEKGIYTSQDYSKSIMFYKIALSNGSVQAMVNLGILYLEGHGPKDEGIFLINQAASLGHPAAKIINRRIEYFKKNSKSLDSDLDDEFLLMERHLHILGDY